MERAEENVDRQNTKQKEKKTNKTVSLTLFSFSSAHNIHPHMGIAMSDNTEVWLLKTLNHGLNTDEALLNLLIIINHKPIALQQKIRHLTLKCGHGLTSFLISAPPCHKDEWNAPLNLFSTGLQSTQRRCQTVSFVLQEDKTNP